MIALSQQTDMEPGQRTVSGTVGPGILTYQGVAIPPECDHMGHLNIAAYMVKFNEGIWSNFANVGLDRKFLDANGSGMAAVETHTKYLREVFAGDVLTIRSRIVEVKDKVVRILHEMTVLDGGMEVPAARCELVAAYFDRAAHKARPFPDAIRAKLNARCAAESMPAALEEGRR
ncbi:acyl-CoA thioesterase [Hwanghaeella sp.]|uniref:acyl-CoA thioesterase n=1 Tax=Hwanghaeella sp. TaxID=2605943 RepID=UPI003CCC1D28